MNEKNKNITDRVLNLIDKNNATSYILEKNGIIKNGTTVLSQWRQGRQKPSVDALLKIADYFNVSLDWLTGRTESETEYAGELFDGTNKYEVKAKKLFNLLNEVEKQLTIETTIAYMTGMLRQKGIDAENIA